MKRYFDSLKEYQSLYSGKERASACFGGAIFTFLLFVPVIILITEMMFVYVYRINLLTIVSILVAFGYSYAWSFFQRKALFLKKPELKDSGAIRFVFFINQFLFGLLILIIGLCFLFWWIPVLMV